MPEFDLGRLVIYMVVLLFAISAHEAAHAWMSNYFGDDTARLLGRITLNPVAHTDPIGTLLLPIAGFIMASTGLGFFLIGWGKPTPVNPLRWRNKDLANVMVSGAGVMANGLIAICALVLIKILQTAGVLTPGPLVAVDPNPLAIFLMMTLMMNASLMVFNLLPFPPLDGSKILSTILPRSFEPIIAALERYGYIILIIALYLGVFNLIFRPVANVIYALL